MNGERVDWFAEIDASTTVAAVATRLGLTVRGRRIVSPPCCNRQDKRGSATAYPLKWSCACGQSGNLTQLVRLSLGTDDWRQVRAWFADAGWCSGEGMRSTWTPPPPREPEPPPDYPPDPFDVLDRGRRVEDDPEVAAFWKARGYGPHTDALFALPAERRGWPAWWGCGFAGVWRLAAPMYDARGVVRSVHARAVVPTDKGKTRSPKGCRIDSLLFADPWIGRWLLRGESVPERVLLCEGITDYAAVTSQRIPGLAVLGGISGSFRALSDIRWPKGCVLYIGTHNDEAGDAYAAEVRVDCETRRVRWGIRGRDASDIVRLGVSVEGRLRAAR